MLSHLFRALKMETVRENQIESMELKSTTNEIKTFTKRVYRHIYIGRGSHENKV